MSTLQIQDLAKLPAPTVVEALDFEAIYTTHRADLVERYPECADVIALESEPLAKLVQAHAYRELLYRQRVNDAARSHLLAYANGADLDHKGAFYGVARLPDELDDRYRLRIQLRIAAIAGNGTREAYEHTAMTASQNVHKAIAMQPWPGSVCVQLWLVDPTQDEATQQVVLAALNASAARPLGVDISVSIAQPRPIHITAHLRRESNAPIDLVARVEASLGPALAAYARLGGSIPRSWITTRLHVEGIASVRYPDDTTPLEITELNDDEYPVLGTVQLIDAGQQP